MRNAIIVDDHPFIRAALKALLEKAGYDVVAQAEDGASAIQLAAEHRPSLIVLDIAIPTVDGLLVLRRLSELDIKSKVLVLSSYPAEFYALRCMKAGAVGFLSKSQDTTELLRAINAVNSGYSYFPHVTLQSVCGSDVGSSEQALIKSLSNRELAIFMKLAAGLDNKQIGEQLLLNNKTVSTYRTRLIEKLGVSSVVHLADMAKRNDLI
ncbi:response regulator [Pseudomonas alkylphenolica]|uniref:response regulator n=1 Tax=Pseudomonas alkylphenolica TaxID=237609 RepID=UPI0018D862C4|nr:response regulator [Pseudomonas alkylphenolica]MBH3429136.1 response regulator [Pseudomonas alkylphenolica]